MKNVANLDEKFVDIRVLLGQDSQNIDFETFEKPVHKNIISSIAALKQNAEDAGFTLSLASGYRDFVQQLTIWNQKAQGLRPVLDKGERPIDIKRVSKTELLFSILRWSALPGASRHHWGTDIDIYDVSSINKGYKLQLTVQETTKGGPFADFYIWLEKFLATGSSGFFRPYEKDRGGVAPEPWHLSHKDCSSNFEKKLTQNVLMNVLGQTDILLKDEIFANFDEIYSRFVEV